jgi:polysaccharide biosynthesis protein PslH
LIKNSVLFLSNSGPFPPHDGKKQRTLALLKALEQQYQVDFLIVDHESDFQLAQKHNENANTRFLKINSKRTVFQNLSKKIGLIFFKDKTVTSYIYQLKKEKNYQFIFSRYIQPVSHIPKGFKIVADIDDDFIELFKTRSKQEKSWYKKIRLEQILITNLWEYKKLKSRVDLLIFVKQEMGFQNALILPNLPFQLLFQQSIEFVPYTKPSLLFVGKLTYEPNLIGIKWFIQNVYPLLLEKSPNLPLTIISTFDVIDQDLDLLLKKYQSITKKINIENIQTVYHKHAVVIAPIFQGAGSNLKVTEALLMGRPVVTTSFGFKGFEDESDFMRVCDDSSKFFEKVKLLLELNDLAEFQKTIFKKASSKYALESWSKQLNDEILKFL